MSGKAAWVSLFHGLAGMCVGWFSGMHYGYLAGLLLAFAGTSVGLMAGVLIGEMPRRVTHAAACIARNRLLAAVLGVSGHLVWLGTGVAFWWCCLSILRSGVEAG